MTTDSDTATRSLFGKRVGFVGKLGGVSRREAAQIVREYGGIPVELFREADIIVIGANELPLEEETILDDSIRELAAEGKIEIINETELWNRLGLLENQTNIRRLYTPAMLAHLLRVPIPVIRRWHRRGLIVPAREVHRLPYFDFQEVATARRLAELLAAGASPGAIEKKLEQLSRLVPEVDRPLSQLSVIVAGRQILLRQGEGLIQPDGQRWLDFESAEHEPSELTSSAGRDTRIIRISETLFGERPAISVEEMVAMASDMEDSGHYSDAIEMYRATLMCRGIDAAICFRLAELLYLVGDKTAARERYSVAVELDEDFVEARANLGCVLAELGELELAAAAFHGAIRFHADYPDVHFHLARVLDELNRSDEAREHWRRFLSLAPDSPWGEEAQARLGMSD